MDGSYKIPTVSKKLYDSTYGVKRYIEIIDMFRYYNTKNNIMSEELDILQGLEVKLILSN